MTDSRKAFIFKFDRSFLVKTQRIHHRVQTALNIPALPYDEQEERHLCPTRCLASYLDRTKEIRKKATLMKLFIPYKEGYSKEISANTISSWITNAIKWSFWLQINRKISYAFTS